MMKDEFSDTGQDRSMEERIIRTSLSAIKGPHRGKILSLFYAFAIVPEDTRTPIEVVTHLFEAESATPLPKPPSLLHIRRWLKVLIDRSLLLGTVDRPSLHDLVRDYVVSSKTDEERRAMNRRLVNLWRARRPSGGGWNIDSKESVPQYIAVTAVHHIGAAWQPDWSADAEAIDWLSDFVDGTQDSIPVLASEALGLERASELAKAAETAEDWWLASLRWSALALSEHRLGAHGRSLPVLQASASALERVEAGKAKNVLEMSVLLLSLQVRKRVFVRDFMLKMIILPRQARDKHRERSTYKKRRVFLQSYNPTIDQVGYAARIQHVVDSNPDEFDVHALLPLLLFTEMWPAMQNCELARLRRGFERIMDVGLGAHERVHPSDHTERCILTQFHAITGCMFSSGLFPVDDGRPIDWGRLFGKQGKEVMDESLLHYDYDQMHVKMRPMTSFDVVL
jgi:hypothetical protein